MSITNKLNQIKNAIYGKEVRGAIHDAIKQVYDDASVNHDNANMEVKMARGTHNTLNDRLNKSDEIQAQTNAQLSKIGIKIGSKHLDDLSDSERINRAIAKAQADNYIVLLEESRYKLHEPIVIKDHILLKSNCKTEIYMSDEFSGEAMVIPETPDTTNFQIENIAFYCNNSIVADGLKFDFKTATPSLVKPFFYLDKIEIFNSGRDGLVVLGSGTAHVENINVVKAERYGIDFSCWDGCLTNSSVGHCKEVAIKVTSGPNRITACKAWGSKIGFLIGGTHNTLSACEAQEDYLALKVDGQMNSIDISVDSAGYNPLTKEESEDGVGIELTTNANICKINAVISNNINKTKPINALKYLLKISGIYNVIDIVGAHVAIDLLHPDSTNSTSNYINIVSNMQKDINCYTRTKSLSTSSIDIVTKDGGIVLKDGLYPSDATAFTIAYQNSKNIINPDLSLNFVPGNGIACASNFYPKGTQNNLGYSTFRWNKLFLENAPNINHTSYDFSNFDQSLILATGVDMMKLLEDLAKRVKALENI